MRSDGVFRSAFFGLIAVLFVISAVVTIVWSTSMQKMGEMPMPGGWTMSMTWMRMPGQTWLGAAASFVGMWIVMTAAMMLPSLTPRLWRYRQLVGRTAKAHLDVLTTLVVAGYLYVWTALGALAFPLGAAVAMLEMRLPALAGAVPILMGMVVVCAGVLQLTRWKAHYLSCCRADPERMDVSPANARTALRYGVRLGVHCTYCCAGLTSILLVIGVMDLRAMALVMTAITLERLAPCGERIARTTGAIAIAAGLLLIVRAIGVS